MGGIDVFFGRMDGCFRIGMERKTVLLPPTGWILEKAGGYPRLCFRIYPRFERGQERMGFVCVCPADLPLGSFRFFFFLFPLPLSHRGHLPFHLIFASDPSDGGFLFRVRWMGWA